MVPTYTIAGRQVGSHVLVMITLGALSGGIAFSMAGSKAQKTQGPPINASNPEEERFIKDFLKNAEKKDTNKAAA